jgi:hypothetical protein
MSEDFKKLFDSTVGCLMAVVMFSISIAATCATVWLVVKVAKAAWK